MQVHKLFDIKPKGNLKSFEEFFLSERRGNWVLDKFIDKKIFIYDSLGRLITEKSINPENGIVNSESHYTYKGELVVTILKKTKWGTSEINFNYDESDRLIKKSFKNSSNDNHGHRYEYDQFNRKIKTTSEFSNKTDIYIFDFSKEGDVEIKLTKCNAEQISTEYHKNGLLVKSINKDQEVTEYNYNEKGLMLSERKIDITRTFKYDKNGFPIEYLGFVSDSDFNKEFYEYDFDEFGNWIEIRCFKENESFPKHLKSIKKRKINYT